MNIWTRVLCWLSRRALKELSPLEWKILDELVEAAQEPLRERLKRQVAAIRGVRHVVDVDGEVEEVFFWFDIPNLELEGLRLTAAPGDLLWAQFDIRWDKLSFRVEIHVVDGLIYGLECRPAPMPRAEPRQAAITLRVLNLMP